MMKRIIFITVVVYLTLIQSCATSPEKVSKEDQDVRGKEIEGREEDSKGDKKEQGKDGASDDTGKEGDQSKNQVYDGLMYVGPAKKIFQKGVDVYFAQGCEKAVGIWKDAFSKDDKNDRIAFNLGLCFSRIKKYDDAAEWYQKAFELNPDFVEPLYNLYTNDELRKKKDVASYENLSEKITDNVEKNNYLAWVYLNEKDYEKSIEFAKAALKEDEQNIDAMVTLGSCYFRKDMNELANAIFSTAVQINPENFKLQRMSGFLAYKMNDKTKAIKHFQMAKKINPEMPEVLNMLAVLYMETEDFELAKKELESALKIKPDFYAAILNLAIAQKGAGDFKKSAELLTLLEKNELKPKDMEKGIFFNKAVLYLDSDVDGDKNPSRFDIAVDYFTKYKKLLEKRDKAEIKRVDDYIKEAQVEKRKLEMFNKMIQQRESKKKAAEEEHKLFLKNKEEAFQKAKAADKLEEWIEFEKKYPAEDEKDEAGLFAKKRISELKPAEKETLKEDAVSKSEESGSGSIKPDEKDAANDSAEPDEPGNVESKDSPESKD